MWAGPAVRPLHSEGGSSLRTARRVIKPGFVLPGDKGVLPSLQPNAFLCSNQSVASHLLWRPRHFFSRHTCPRQPFILLATFFSFVLLATFFGPFQSRVLTAVLIRCDFGLGLVPSAPGGGAQKCNYSATDRHLPPDQAVGPNATAPEPELNL